jgi:hypothetical protein
MPDWLVVLLKKNGQVTSQGAQNVLFAVMLGIELTTTGVVSVLALLFEQSSSTKYAYLCHPSVQHVSKLRREGKSPSSLF